MAEHKKRSDFLATDEGRRVERALQAMVSDTVYHTVPSYSANAELYPDNSRPFIDKHLTYLRDHPAVNVDHYLSNLRLMTRVKVRV